MFLGDLVMAAVWEVAARFEKGSGWHFFVLAGRCLEQHLRGALPDRPAASACQQSGGQTAQASRGHGVDSEEALYRELVSQWRGTLPLRTPDEPKILVADPAAWPRMPSYTERMMAVDSLSYLPDDILVKVDRAAMAESLETRVPFLDERVISFGWGLPLHQKIRDDQGKWLLRQLLYRYVSQALVDRPKQGFGVPIEQWLRGPLRDWVEELLSPDKLASDGLLDPVPIRAMWARHLGGRNVQYALWNILMYQAWRQRWH